MFQEPLTECIKKHFKNVTLKINFKMKKIYFIILFTFFYISTSISQNTFYVGNKTYDSSEEYELKSNEIIGGTNLNVIIAKDGENGLFVVSSKLYSDSYRIKGKLIIYLDDKSIITCMDRGRYDYTDDTATTVYNLTKEEILRLKNSNIYSIRFNIGGINKFVSGFNLGAHTVRNYPKKDFYETTRIDFTDIIYQLFY